MNQRTIKRLLVANRGEIAVRVIRAARELGIESVAIYSDVDAGTLPMRLADDRIALGGSLARDTYLNQNKIIAAAIQTGADSIHPGYGFLAENAEFARRVEEEGLSWIGPQAELIALMGDKAAARDRAEALGLPLVPGSDVLSPDLSESELLNLADKLGFPIMVKASAGGSGRGMRLVHKRDELVSLLAEAQQEAKAAFGNDSMLLERSIERPRHIEVQVFGDGCGNAVHFGERECSVQRRHQKLVEEAPAPHLHDQVRRRLTDAAQRLVQGLEYRGAGTVEFLVEDGRQSDSSFYFLEMNTRIQVEHPVTELVTGVDLVSEQLKIANGEGLSRAQEAISLNGHAIEFRVYAEDPSRDFSPVNGEIKYISRLGGAGVREDSWVEAGDRISAYYDSLLAKLCVWGEDREAALARARSLLANYEVEGLATTLDFHRWLLAEKDYLSGRIDVTWLERSYAGQLVPANSVGPLVLPQR